MYQPVGKQVTHLPCCHWNISSACLPSLGFSKIIFTVCSKKLLNGGLILGGKKKADGCIFMAEEREIACSWQSCNMVPATTQTEAEFCYRLQISFCVLENLHRSASIAFHLQIVKVVIILVLPYLILISLACNSCGLFTFEV